MNVYERNVNFDFQCFCRDDFINIDESSQNSFLYNFQFENNFLSIVFNFGRRISYRDFMNQHRLFDDNIFLSTDCK